MHQKLDKPSLDALANSSVPAPFVPSETYKARVQLIKVPKFVADVWATKENRSIVGAIVPPSGPTDQPKLIVPDSLKSLGVAVYDGKQRSSANLYVMKTRHNNAQHADICGYVEGVTTFIPKLDSEYHAMLKKRHQDNCLFKSRSTTEETRGESYDTMRTLFQYYNPRRDGYDSMIAADGGRLNSDMLLNFQRAAAKAKQKKLVTMTDDMLRMRLFQMFEKAGDEGLTLKRVGLEVDQPLNFIKSVLEEVGEQRRRLSDRRVVYFLKGHYIPSGGGVVDDLNRQAKKIRKA